MELATIVYTLFSLVLLLAASRHLFGFSGRKAAKRLPPSPRAVPILGNLFHLKKPLHRTFRAIADDCGPIFSLRIGSRLIVVVSSPSLVQECFNDNDIVFANRPRFLNSTYVGYNNTTIGTAPYGDHWRNIRRIATTEMLSPQRLSLSQSIRTDEVRRMVVQLASASRGGYAHVELKNVIAKVVLNNVMRIIAGKRYYDDNQSKEDSARMFHGIMQDVLDKSGVGNPADYFPIIKWFSSKYVNRVKELGFRMNEFMQCLVDELRSKEERTDTMLGHLLTLQEKRPEDYPDQTIKGLIQAMILAGTDTSIATVTWAMSNLLNHPHVIEKAHKEIDNKLGQSLLDESALPDLPYLQSIIYETFRLYPPVPFLLPHCSSADCTVGGYHIPGNTILLANTWAIQRDPKIWDDPDSFIPERFENEQQVDAYKLVPFGIGRRACPGATLGHRTVGLILGTLLQCFDWKRVSEEKVDMTEGTGLNMHKLQPLEAMCKARPAAIKVLDEVQA